MVVSQRIHDAVAAEDDRAPLTDALGAGGRPRALAGALGRPYGMAATLEVVDHVLSKEHRFRILQLRDQPLALDTPELPRPPGY